MKLLLIRHAPTPSTRRAAFAIEETLDEAGLQQAADLRTRLPRRVDRWLCSPAKAACDTVRTAGFPAEVDFDLGECDFGSWAGRTLEEVEAADPEGLQSWFDDPRAVPHGGESIGQMVERVRRLLDRVRNDPGTTGAVTHAGVIRAAVVVALEAPEKSFWRIDIAPLSVTELHSSGYGWRLACVNRS